MSLINQMLRDLEQRNIEKTIFEELPYATPSPRLRLSPVLLSLLLIAVLASVYWFYQQNTGPKPAVEQTVKPRVKILPFHLPPVAMRMATPIKVTQTSMAVLATPFITAKPVAPKPEALEAVQEDPVMRQAQLLYLEAAGSPSKARALSKLESVLRLNPRHLEARLLMAQLLYSQGQLERTAQFLDESLEFFPGRLAFINTRAQIFLQQKNPAAALHTLLKAGLKSSSNVMYLSLLAAAYQQQNLYSDAANVYGQLVNIDPDKVEHWLGLALAHDNLGNTGLAREAYEAALSKNSANPAVVGYIKQRLSALQ